jgi:hypothetical protein
MKKLAQAFLIATCILCILSCNQEQKRARMFIDYYNNVLGQKVENEFTRSNPSIIAKTNAELLPEDKDGNTTIQVLFVSKFTYSDPSLNVYKKLVPPAFSLFLKDDKNALELLENGAKFKILYTSRNRKSAEELIIDKVKLDELIREGAEKKLMMAKSYKPLKPQVRQLVNSFNNALPLVINKELGIKVVNIDVDQAKNLVYHVEVGTKTAKDLKNEKVKKTIKDELLGDAKLSALYDQIKKVDLVNIKYLYQDKAGKQLLEIIITEEDMNNRVITMTL